MRSPESQKGLHMTHKPQNTCEARLLSCLSPRFYCHFHSFVCFGREERRLFHYVLIGFDYVSLSCKWWLLFILTDKNKLVAYWFTVDLPAEFQALEMGRTPEVATILKIGSAEHLAYKGLPWKWHFGQINSYSKENILNWASSGSLQNNLTSQPLYWKITFSTETSAEGRMLGIRLWWLGTRKSFACLLFRWLKKEKLKLFPWK